MELRVQISLLKIGYPTLFGGFNVMGSLKVEEGSRKEGQSDVKCCDAKALPTIALF